MQITYVITDGEFFKIGIASNVHTRIMGIKSSNPRPITLVKLYWGTQNEGLFHYYLQEFHLSGEWFNCSIDDIMKVDYLMHENSKIDFDPIVYDKPSKNVSIHGNWRGGGIHPNQKAILDALRGKEPKVIIDIDGFIPF